MESIESWDSNEVNSSIKDKWFGPPPYFITAVDSTNSYIRKLYDKGYPTGTIVVAESQTHGRGRMQRVWFSPSGLGIWMSILFPPVPGDFGQAALLFAASLAVCEIVDEFTSAKGEIKWPNDVLVYNKKLCGILAEGIIKNQKLEMIILGIGINVNHVPSDFPPEIRDKAISLKIINSCTCLRELILASFLKKMNTSYSIILNKGVTSVFDRWIKRCGTVGKNIHVISGSRELHGLAESISETGVLCLRTSEGKRVEISAGDIYM